MLSEQYAYPCNRNAKNKTLIYPGGSLASRRYLSRNILPLCGFMGRFMATSAIQAYLARWGVAPQCRVFVLTLLLQTVTSAKPAGAFWKVW
jgi:hypothetical protein